MTFITHINHVISFVMYCACVQGGESFTVEVWANRRGLGAACAQVPRVAVTKCSVAFVSARASKEIAGREERRTMIGHVRSEGACGGIRIPRGPLTGLKSQKWWRESWALPGDARVVAVGGLHCRRERAEYRGGLHCRRERAEYRGGLHCRRERAEYRGRTLLPEGEGREPWADSTAGGRGLSVVGGLHCRRERAEYHGGLHCRREMAEYRGGLHCRREMAEYRGAGGRWPSVVGGLHCRREMAECRGRTPLPEGDGRVLWADSAAGGRWPSVVGGLRCRREMAECHGRTLLPEGEGRIFGCREESQALLEKRSMDKDERRYQPEGSGASSWSSFF